MIHCRYCREDIADPTTARFARGGAFHEDCFQEVEENQQRISDEINSFDKLTSVEVSLDVKKMEEDGMLNDPADYTEERFRESIEKRMKSSNAETSSIGCSTTIRDKKTGEDKSTGRTVTIHIKRETHLDGDVFTYNYRSARWNYIRGVSSKSLQLKMLLFPFIVKWKQKFLFRRWVYKINFYWFTPKKQREKFFKMLDDNIRYLIWKSTPNWDKYLEQD